jgi:gamma-glutamyltranspeptidase/glutathione hydrolase
MPPHRNAYRPVVMGTRGAVAAAHPLASMAGIRVLLDGGNAVDAAVAVGSTLNVVEPFMSGAGGIGLMLVSRAHGRERHVLDFIGRAPAAADPARATEDELAGGPKSCATPGNLGGWLAALDRFGSMPRQRVLAPAIELAESGAPLTWMNARFFEQARATLQRSAEAGRLYGGPLRPGHVLTYKDLAATLRQVAEGGAEAFYRGSIARTIARAVREAGGWLSEADLAAFAPEWREPLSITYRGWEVSSVPPPFSAFQMLETLNILEGFDVAGWGQNSVEYLHHFIEAVKLGSADRLAYAYSPDVPVRGLVAKSYAASQRARIDAARAAVSEGERFSAAPLPGQIAEGHPARFADEQTTHFACADAHGTVVSVTQTLGVPFGSGFAVPGTGLILNNILKWMDRDPASPNVLRPGKKAGTMMSPTQVFRDGGFIASIGTPGSYGILQTQPQMLLNLLEFGMNIQEAIEAPRVRVYRDRLLDAEARIDADTRAGLARRGHDVNVIDEWSWVVGGGQGIARDPESGALMAGADPRRDGYALAI